MFEKLAATFGEDAGTAFTDQGQQDDEVRFGAAEVGGVVASAYGTEEGGLEAGLVGGARAGQ